MNKRKFDIVIVGGLGHAGLPLGLSFAREGLKVCLYDIDAKNAGLVRRGRMPFMEQGAEEVLVDVLKNKKLEVSLDQEVVAQAEYVIIAIGTPVADSLSPEVNPFLEFFPKMNSYLDNRQILVIRSTVYPRTCRQIPDFLDKKRGPWHIAYCPERTIQGYAMKELKELPQIVAALTDIAEEKACDLFGRLSPKLIKVSVEEAELAKLFANAWRYIQFAVANQFYMMAHQFDVDFDRVRRAMTDSYGRGGGLPSAGLAAGPCLLKDTLQLASSCGRQFFLGRAAIMVNEGLPDFIVEILRAKHDLKNKKVGILGMAFKADIDDIRGSLSYKLARVFRLRGAQVFCSDEYIRDPGFISKEQMLQTCEIIVVGVPHTPYRELVVPKEVEVLDLWGITKTKEARWPDIENLMAVRA